MHTNITRVRTYNTYSHETLAHDHVTTDVDVLVRGTQVSRRHEHLLRDPARLPRSLWFRTR